MLHSFDVGVGTFMRGLTNLKQLLAKAERHAAAQGIEPHALLGARLADDMYDLATQVHWSVAGALLAADRLLGLEARAPGQPAQSFAQLQQSIDAALASLQGVDAEQLEAGLARTIVLPQRGGSRELRGAAFLLEFALPSFFFHFASAYGILRNAGVPVQKGDFLGW